MGSYQCGTCELFFFSRPGSCPMHYSRPPRTRHPTGWSEIITVLRIKVFIVSRSACLASDLTNVVMTNGVSWVPAPCCFTQTALCHCRCQRGVPCAAARGACDAQCLRRASAFGRRGGRRRGGSQPRTGARGACGAAAPVCLSAREGQDGATRGSRL